MLADSDFSEVVRQFPPIDFGFAYGSGVVEQGGYNYSKAKDDVTKITNDKENDKEEIDLPMVDMIFAVEDPQAWHSANMALNPCHYTPLITLSSSRIAGVQDKFGAGIWYNAMVAMNISRFPNRQMKYGVISCKR
jgi:translocator assembly and maintenance protein 41